MSENEYMESKISNSKFKNQRTREIIKQTFKQRECFTLVRPVQDDKLLKLLGVSDLEETGQLRREFMQGLHVIKQFIFDQTPIKTNRSNGSAMKPSILAALIQSYVAEINRSRQEGGAIPSLSSAWETIVQEQQRTCYKKCNEHVNKELDALVLPQVSVMLLLNFDLIRRKVEGIVDRVRGLLEPSDKQGHQLLDRKQDELSKQMEAQFKKVLGRNEQKSYALFQQIEAQQFSVCKNLEC